MLIVTAHLRTRPERATEMRELARSVMPPTLAEPACDFYEYFQHLDRPDEFMCVQRWHSLAGLFTHAEHTSQGRRVASELAGLCVRPPDIRVHTIGATLEWPPGPEKRKELRP